MTVFFFIFFNIIYIYIYNILYQFILIFLFFHFFNIAWVLHQSWFVGHELVDPKRQRCFCSVFGARILVLRFELFGNCLARLCQSFEYRCGEGFHVNSSWDYLVVPFCQLRKLQCFKHAHVWIRRRVVCFENHAEWENLSVFQSRGKRLWKPVCRCRETGALRARSFAKLRSWRSFALVERSYPSVFSSHLWSSISGHCAVDLFVWRTWRALRNGSRKMLFWSVLRDGRVVVDLAVWWRYLETRLKDGRLRKYNGNSTEFKFVFVSYSGVVARITDLVALMSSMSKMRTGTSDRSATESCLIPIECGWDKGKNKEHEEKGNENPKSGFEWQLQKMGHNDAQWLAWKRETG